jgi:hypothetical protein
VRVYQFVSAIRAVGVPVFVCLRSSGSAVTFMGLMVKVIVQNDGDFVGAILLY